MSAPGHNSRKAGPVDAAKLTAFADRMRNLREAFKEDVSSLIDDAGEANIEAPALRRLVSWLSQDHGKRAEREAIDDQYRFLAGERATPATPPAESLLALAIELYRNDATVRTVAETLGVSVGKAHALRTQAAAFLVHVHENVNTPKMPEMVAGDLGEWLPPHDLGTGEILAEEISLKAPAASILPSPGTWQGITYVREAYHARIEAEREARRLARQQDQERALRLSRLTDDDMPPIPDFLRRSAA